MIFTSHVSRDGGNVTFFLQHNNAKKLLRCEKFKEEEGDKAAADGGSCLCGLTAQEKKRKYRKMAKCCQMVMLNHLCQTVNVIDFGFF